MNKFSSRRVTGIGIVRFEERVDEVERVAEFALLHGEPYSLGCSTRDLSWPQRRKDLVVLMVRVLQRVWVSFCGAERWSRGHGCCSAGNSGREERCTLGVEKGFA